MQLNKYLALCGAASRRKANHLIVEGRVAVNGKTVQKLGVVVDPESDEVKLDGRRLTVPRQYRYVLLNKPAGTITSAIDGRGRKTVLDVLNASERLFPVGRLDLDTEGILLITNDGDLAFRLAHPKYEIQKIYHAKIEGRITDEAVGQLQQGVKIEPGVYVRGDINLLSRGSDFSLVEIQIHEGKKRQIKRMLNAVGFPVQKLVRINFAGLTAGGLGIGEWRELSEEEVKVLYRMTGLKKKEKKSNVMSQ
ncbi:rRNA pseudouridine synthase [bacterium]|nr:rRNA pseudouridine synthase [bacterium]